MTSRLSNNQMYNNAVVAESASILPKELRVNIIMAYLLAGHLISELSSPSSSALRNVAPAPSDHNMAKRTNQSFKNNHHHHNQMQPPVRGTRVTYEPCNRQKTQPGSTG